MELAFGCPSALAAARAVDPRVAAGTLRGPEAMVDRFLGSRRTLRDSFGAAAGVSETVVRNRTRSDASGLKEQGFLPTASHKSIPVHIDAAALCSARFHLCTSAAPTTLHTPAHLYQGCDDFTQRSSLCAALQTRCSQHHRLPHAIASSATARRRSHHGRFEKGAAREARRAEEGARPADAAAAGDVGRGGAEIAELIDAEADEAAKVLEAVVQQVVERGVAVPYETVEKPEEPKPEPAPEESEIERFEPAPRLAAGPDGRAHAIEGRVARHERGGRRRRVAVRARVPRRRTLPRRMPRGRA